MGDAGWKGDSDVSASAEHAASAFARLAASLQRGASTFSEHALEHVALHSDAARQTEVCTSGNDARHLTLTSQHNFSLGHPYSVPSPLPCQHHERCMTGCEALEHLCLAQYLAKN